MWLQRITTRIQHSTLPVLIEGDRAHGIDTIVRALGEPKCPLMMLDLEGLSDADSVEIGNLLVDQMEEAFGFKQFGYGMPAAYGLRFLERSASLMAPYRIALLRADEAPRLANHVAEFTKIGVRVVVSASNVEALSAMAIHSSLRMSPTELGMSRHEAVVEARELIGADLAEQAWVQSEGWYGLFLNLVNEWSDLPPLSTSASEVRVPDAQIEALLSLYLRQSRLVDFFELAVYRSPGLAIRHLGSCASALLDRGLFDRLWALMNQLPSDVLDDEEALYWYFTAALAVNEHKAVLPRVRRALDAHEAPDLRARVAASVPSHDSLREAERAYQCKKTVNTARAYGFVLTMNARYAEAIQVLTDALNLAEAVADRRSAVATASDISHAMLFAGAINKAKRWARWGLRQYEQEALGDELLRLNVLNQLSYTSLLTDEVDAAEDLVRDLNFTRDQLEIPMMEGIASTVADIHVVRDQIQAAIQIYEDIYAVAGRSVAGFAGVDLAKAYCLAGRNEDAAAVAHEAQALAIDSSLSNQCAADLAVAHVGSCTGELETPDLFRSVLATYGSSVGSQYLVQAVLGLANSLRHRDHDDKAAEIMRQHWPMVAGYGHAGWLLALASHEDARQLWSWHHGEANEYSFALLGTITVSVRGQLRSMSKRFADVVAVLAANPAGLSGEALLLEIYGDDGNISTLKAVLSRLRRLVPIESQPYRIAKPFTADFVDLERLLGEGKVREALELYKGPLLPDSEAPGVARMRERLDEAVRQAVLHVGERDLVIRLAKKFPEDLELWERAQEITPHTDPAYPLVRARVRRIRGEWGL